RLHIAVTAPFSLCVAAGLQLKAPGTSAAAVRLGYVGYLEDSPGESTLWSDDEGGAPRKTWPPSRPVTVQCQEAQLVVTVHRDLFGTGRLIKAADLSLGPAACPYTSLNA
uniref:Uncharacterized protein n=1 Tax=Sphenodon punctatus TaxID=8508 RepID=A0A8D0G6S9_SPHPU